MQVLPALRPGCARAGGEPMITEAIRRRGIGGSEIAAILGVDDNHDAFGVWAKKKGGLSRTPATPRMRLGKAFERGIIGYYAELTGREVEFVDETFQDPARPFMVYTPDALCVHERRGVDAKFVSVDQRFKWGPTADDIPAYIQAQAWWYMAALDYDVWDVAAVVSDGEPRIYTIERDLKLEAEILRRAEEFWTRYIEGDERPPVGYSEDSRRWIHEQFPRHTERIREATEDEVAVLDAYSQIRFDEKVLGRQREQLENDLTKAIANAEGLTWARGKVTWKTPKESMVTNWKALADRLMGGYGPDDRAALLQEFTEAKPNTRRFLWKADKEATQ
jgi:predicted phage-related endonuclease